MPSAIVTNERLDAAAQKLPAAPRIHNRLRELLHDVNCDIGDVVELVRVDTSLGSSVVRVSNSPIFRRGMPVKNLDEAINRIGLREVHRLVGLAMAAQLCASALPLYGVSAEQLWENAVATAVALAELSGGAGEDDRLGYTLGLLRPVGRVVLHTLAVSAKLEGAAGTKPADYERWETASFGLTAGDVTAKLLTMWGFNGASSEPMRYQFKPEQHPARGRWPALLHLAGFVTSQLGKDLACEAGAWRRTDQLESQAGVSGPALEACVFSTRTELNRLKGLLRAVTGTG